MIALLSVTLNLLDAITRTIDFTNEAGKRYELRPDSELATIVVRPRGFHLPEKHILVDGEITSGSFVEDGRVNGMLALSRAIGDFDYKPV